MMSTLFAVTRPQILAALLLVVLAGCDNTVDLAVADPTLPPEGWTLVWSDEFDGTTLDKSRWEVQTGDGCPNLCGWGNNELQWYQAENITIRDGRLVIEAVQEDTSSARPYTSGRLRTKGLGDWTYGRFEVRARLPVGQGFWSAIWMLSSDEVYGEWAASGEIDIMEAIGNRPGEIFGTLHYGDTFPLNTSSGQAFNLVHGTFADDFFVFAIEWEEGVIRWYINNVLYLTQTEWSTTGGDFPAPFDQPFHILLNLAVGGNLPGPPDETSIFPQRMEVDYVRVYERTE